MRLLGLDVGGKGIGLALSDADGLLAHPRGALVRKGEEKDMEALLAMIRAEGVERVVVGLPRSLNGSLGPQARTILAFVEDLKAKAPVPVEVWDEKLSTAEAERLLSEAGHRRPSKERRDAAAAAIILQGYLDHRRYQKP
jgi:putative Holliday junction resolvase